jgi:hypothetical protein
MSEVTSSYKIFPSSDKASQPSTNQIGKVKYPWTALQVGQSFQVGPEAGTRLSTLQSSCSKMGKKLGKRFRAVDHGPSVGIEVARLSDKAEEPKVIIEEKPKFF